MSFQTNAVTAPAGERETVLVRLRHFTWATDIWYVDDVVAWNVDDENGDPVTALPIGLDADGEPTDETGIDSRGITLADPMLFLWRRLEKLSRTGNSAPVEVTVYRYLTSDLTQPATVPAVLAMKAPSRDGRLVTFDASNANTINRDAPALRFTYSGNPGLRR